jgi:hypothetical protein
MHGFHGTSFIRTTAALAFGFASRLSRGFALRLPRGALHVCSSNYRQHIPVGSRHRSVGLHARALLPITT